ncbi:MAG: [FeFe] hydrogenase H-cluster maturation GTPase HydF [Bacillota bacterium]|nr:[FeFe] hydrogenase H-cluster maturation GTPase HydF [Bacillota bacterium]
MNTTPNSNRINISIYGKRNVGKSSLLNAVLGQDISVVSSVKGTTTDPVKKAMELIPLGPVLFIDTAGHDDRGELGDKRVDKSMKILHQTDFAVYVMEADDLDEIAYKEMKRNFKRFNISHMPVINKIDTVPKHRLTEIKNLFPDATFVSSFNENTVLKFKDELINRIDKFDQQEATMIGDIVPYSGKVIMVVPIDSEAPKGRIILPQVQLIRDCLDNGIKSYVTRDVELKDALADLKDVDLVVTDSQAFKEVSEIVPQDIKLSSFSILLSRTKGDLNEFIKGVHALDKLKEGARILISESCTHNSTCEDIGRFKIPRAIKNYTNKTFNYDVRSGNGFPSDVSSYDLVVHCASCMLNRKSMQTRIQLCRENNVPITNYGILLAYLNEILQRSIEIFNY